MDRREEKNFKALRREKKRRPKMAVHGRSFKRELIKRGQRVTK